MKVTVAVPTLGRESLFHTLASLRRQTVPPDEIVIAHQGEPSLIPDIEAASPGARVLLQEVKGVSRARNAAMRAAQSEWVLWTDDDQEVAPDWVENLRALVGHYSEVAMLGGAVLPPVVMPEGYHCDQLTILRDTLIDKDNYLVPPVRHPNVDHSFWSGNFAVRKAAFQKVGPFDEELGRGSTFPVGEDIDFAARVISAGFKGLLSPRLVIYHTYGTRPAHINTADDAVVTTAIMLWKAARQPGLLDPEIAAKLLPYGRKKALLAKLSGGALYGDQLRRSKLFQETRSRLDREYTVEGGCLKRE
ncbi:MAG TPA: glycosyltransferase [Fimbriimonadaceae bacterium]|nr:glycosyltransferase [Fimbriimonadaceae bacterium]